MSGDPIKQLEDQLLADAALLGEFKRDPIAVLGAHGINVTTEMRTRVRAWNPGSLSDEELTGVLENEGMAAHL